ncbi:mechanosensitive ion channel family protein [uncultured Methanomethylovorans sp.]|uniref:mechanosensitive ion channel family protein n=1 Tax=uncultured Methanomethylovorans sp. TaxID=183759 RepID=UPI002AA6664A|nr:mechanosensitive ion channel family protein [uncultured Methanomethylovorans sp.]
MAQLGVDTIVSNFENFDLNTVFLSVVILIFAAILSKTVAFLLTKLSETTWKYRLYFKSIISVSNVLIYSLAFYYILAFVFALSLNQLVIFSGFIGAVIGFGMRNLFEDIAGGIIITMEKPYQVGDRIEMGNYYGEVKDIGLRATRIVTPDDSLVSAPNNLIFTQSVASGNSGSPEMMATLDIYIENDSDVDLAMKILREAVVTSRFVYISPTRPVVILLNDYPFYKGLKARAYVNDLRNEFIFRSDITQRTWNEFYKRGIKPPKAPIMNYEKTAE